MPGADQRSCDSAPKRWEPPPVEQSPERPLPVEPDKLLPFAEMHTLPKAQAAVREAVGSPLIVDAALDELILAFDPDATEKIFILSRPHEDRGCCATI